jgi:hypothetical protein
MIESRTKNWVWKPPRVRKEPPTIREALDAARGLSADADEQLEIAASLMGVSIEAVGLAAGPRLRPRPTRLSSAVGGGTVIVERKIRRTTKASL